MFLYAKFLEVNARAHSILWLEYPPKKDMFAF